MQRSKFHDPHFVFRQPRKPDRSCCDMSWFQRSGPLIELDRVESEKQLSEKSVWIEKRPTCSGLTDAALHPPTFSWHFGACLLKKLERTASKDLSPAYVLEKRVWEIDAGGTTEPNNVTRANVVNERHHELQLNWTMLKPPFTDDASLIGFKLRKGMKRVSTANRFALSFKFLEFIMEFPCVGSGTEHFFDFDSRYPQALP